MATSPQSPPQHKRAVKAAHRLFVGLDGVGRAARGRGQAGQALPGGQAVGADLKRLAVRQLSLRMLAQLVRRPPNEAATRIRGRWRGCSGWGQGAGLRGRAAAGAGGAGGGT